jgi:hypothetical protein
MIVPNASVSQRFFASQCRSLRASMFDHSRMPRSCRPVAGVDI